MKNAIHILFSMVTFLLLLNLQQAKSQITAPLADLPIMVDFSDFTGANMSSAYPGWDEADGEPPTPLISESGWYSSEVMYDKAVAVSLNSNTHREWVITPEFEATGSTKLTFDAAVSLLYNDPSAGFMDTDDSVAIMVSTNGTDFYAIFAFGQNNLPGLEMEQFDIALGDFAGEEIRVAFYGTDGNISAGQCAFHFDNVVIKNDPLQDAKAFELVLPKTNMCYSENQNVVVSIKNDGQQSIYSVPVRVKVRGAAIRNLYNVYNGYIEPGDTAVFAVGTFDMSQPGIYEFTVQTELPNDGFALNNTKTDTVVHDPVMTKPHGPLDFTDYYDENLSEIYPGWFEARGFGYPVRTMDTDWQGNNNLGDRTANVYYTFTYTYDWIIGPKFHATENTKLKFDAAIEYEVGSQMGSDDKLAIMVSVDCGQSWEEADVIDQSTGIYPFLTGYSVSLADYAGEDVMVAFYATTGETSDTEKFFMHIDDVLIADFYPVDAGISALLQPLNPCGFSDEETIEVTVNNYGETAISGVDLFYRVNGGTPVSENLSNTINPGNSFDYTFTETADLSGGQELVIEAWTSLSGDQNPDNDTLVAPVSTSSFNLATEGAYTMGFEPDEDYSDWLVEDVNGDNFIWELNTEGEHAHNGVQSYWYSSNNSSVQSNDWFISPCFNLEAGSIYMVSFYYKNRASVFPEKLKLHMGTEQSASAMDELIVDLGEIDNGSYLLSETPVSIIESGTYYFGWHAYGEADQFGCHIDDVEIRQVFNNDLAVERVNVQRSYVPGSCVIENADTVTVTVKNAGNMTENSIPLSLAVNNGTPVAETFSETLLPGESIDLILDDGIDVPADEAVDVTAWTSLAADLNKANDTLKLEDLMLSDLYMDFEPYEDFAGWTQQSLIGATTWELIGDADLSYSGDYCYGIRTDINPNNDYLYSSCIHLEADACYTLSFYYRSRFSTEYMEVFLATDQVNTAVIDTISVLNGFNSNSYLYEESVFNVETSGDYHLVWHTQGGQSGRYWIYIDKISMYENDLGPEAAIDYTILDREVSFTAELENATEIAWDFGDGNSSTLQNPDHTYADDGTYTVTFTASNECNQIVLEEEVTIDCPVDADFTFSMPVQPNVVEFVATTEATGYLWDFDTGDLSFEQNPVYTFPEVGEYDVSLQTMNACGIDSTSQAVQITEVDIGEYVDWGEKLQIYPNPTGGKIFILAPAGGKMNIRITDTQGKILTEVVHENDSGRYSLDLETFHDGIYFLEIQQKEQIFREKVIKH